MITRTPTVSYSPSCRTVTTAISIVSTAPYLLQRLHDHSEGTHVRRWRENPNYFSFRYAKPHVIVIQKGEERPKKPKMCLKSAKCIINHVSSHEVTGLYKVIPTFQPNVPLNFMHYGIYSKFVVSSIRSSTCNCRADICQTCRSYAQKRKTYNNNNNAGRVHFAMSDIGYLWHAWCLGFIGEIS